MILSDAVIAKETRPTSAPKGRILTEKLHSDILGGGRTYHVYLPSDFEEDRQLPLLVALDGESMLGPAASVPLPTILDNLIATKRIPRMAAILVESTTERARDLISSHAYADFLVKELLPKVRGAYGVTSDPTRTILAGYSFGGLQAAYSSLLYSRTFGNALCLSPSFWANPEVSQDLDFYRENLVQPMLMDSNVRSSGVRFFLTYGIFESLIQLPTRHIRDMLKLNGMFVDWREYPANHCCLSWSNGFVDGLISLAGGW
jgi:enterochelin esterase family protein